LLIICLAVVLAVFACQQATPPEMAPPNLEALHNGGGGCTSYNIAVFLVSPDGMPWNDTSGNPVDPVQVANEIMFGDGVSNYHVAGLFEEMSYGALCITGATFGPYNVTSPPGEACDVISWRTDALAAWQNEDPVNHDPADYDRFVYAFPIGAPCTTTNITDGACRPPGFCYLGGCAPSPNVYVFNMMQASVYAHELGHTFGLSHCYAPNASGQMSLNLDFTTVMSATGVAANPCQLPDPADIPIPLRIGNTPQMIYKDWIHSDNVEVITAAGTYTYDLRAVEVADPNANPAQTMAAEINYGTTNAVISFRTDQGTFQGNPQLYTLFTDPAFLAAGNIYDWDGVYWFHSVDIHSGVGSGTNLLGVIDDGAHNVYTDPNGKYEVTFLYESNDEAHVQIVVNPEDQVSVTPSTISAPATAGLDSGNPYVLTITNNYDFARTYDVTGEIENTSGGLSCSVWPVDPVTVPALSSTDVNVYLYFNGLPPVGSACLFHVTATQQEAPYQELTQGFLQRVVTACTTPPSAPWGLSASAPHQWVDLFWHASTPVCGTILRYEVYRVGAGVVGTTTNLSFTDTSTQANTLYTYKVRAIDTHFNASAWSNSYKIRTGDEIIIQGM